MSEIDRAVFLGLSHLPDTNLALFFAQTSTPSIALGLSLISKTVVFRWVIFLTAEAKEAAMPFLYRVTRVELELITKSNGSWLLK